MRTTRREPRDPLSLTLAVTTLLGRVDGDVDDPERNR